MPQSSRFDFFRAVGVDSVEKINGGMILINTTNHGKYCLPKEAVRTATTRYLNATDRLVVDLGRNPTERPPTRAIIAARHKDKLPQL